MNTADTSFQDKLETLRQAFLTRTGNEADELEARATALETPDSGPDLEHIRTIAHRIAGGGGIFGLNNLTAPAVALEESIINRCGGPDVREKISALVAEIRRDCDRHSVPDEAGEEGK